MTSRDELLALAAQLDADGADQHIQLQEAPAVSQQPASEAAQRRKRASELVRSNEATRLLGLQVSTSSTSTPPLPPPAWPRSELPVLPPPKSLKRSAPVPKVPRAVRQCILARLAAEHALLLAAASSAATPNDESSSSSPSSLTSLLVEAVRGSAALRRAATALALKQEETSLFKPSTGKETYLARARAETALSAAAANRTSAAEVLAAAAALESSKKRKKERSDDDEGEEEGRSAEKKRKKKSAAPDPNPTPLPVLREQQREREKEKEKEEPRPLPPPQQLEEAEIDWEAATEALPQNRAAASLLHSPRSAISAVVSAALVPFVEDKQVSKEAAAAAAARATSKVLASFWVSPLGSKAEKEERRKGNPGGALNAAAAAFLTDSQRGKIAQFARKCLDEQEKKKEKE